MTSERKHNNELQEALNFDPIADAEDKFGRNTKESQAIGLMSHLANSAKKKKMLEELGDTPFSCKVEKYLQIIGAFGFELALKENLFRERKDEKSKDTLYVFWYDELGILLVFDTYGESINGSTFYYNYHVKFKSKGGTTSTGSFHRDSDDEFRRLHHYDKNVNLLETKEIYVRYPEKLDEEQEAFNKKLWEETYGLWIGNHDGREALKHKINCMKEAGTLLSQWIEPECTFSITCGEDYKDKNGEDNHIDHSLRRLELLPDNVKQKICYDKIIKQHTEWKNR